MKCPHCAEAIPTDSVFCPECGKEIVAKTPASATAAAPPAQDGPSAAPAQAFARSAPLPPAATRANPPANRNSKGLWFAIAVIAAVGAIYALVNLGGSTDDPPPDNDGGDHPYRSITQEETVWSSVEFDAAAGDRIIVRAEALEDGADPMVVLESDQGGYWENDDVGGTLNALLEIVAESDDYFYADVRPVDENDSRLTLFTVEINP